MPDPRSSPDRSLPDRDFLLGPLLKRVSRSFYLSLRVLPARLREPVALAYLLARAADTLADSPSLRGADRLAALLVLRSLVQGRGAPDGLLRITRDLAPAHADPSERALLLHTGAALQLLQQLSPQDRDAVRRVVTTLSEGMQWDLQRFGDGRAGAVAALETLDELDRYTYLVAGCVGEFWTELACAHDPALRGADAAALAQRGVRFGKALQFVNVVRDAPQDLRNGRCYVPARLLAQEGLAPQDLLDPQRVAQAWPVQVSLMRLALDHFGEARSYLLALPARSVRLRLACLWPVMIGLRTLELLAQGSAWVDAERPCKLPRAQVYGLLLRSLGLVASNAALARWIDASIAEVERRCERRPP